MVAKVSIMEAQATIRFVRQGGIELSRAWLAFGLAMRGWPGIFPGICME